MSTRMTLGKTLIVVLVCILSCGFIMWAFGGLNDMSVENAKDVFERKLNEDNLYTSECVTITDRNDGNGIKVTVNENGSITVKGEADSVVNYPIATVSLKAGEYTFTALEGASLKGAYVSLSLEGVDISADFTGNTFTVVEDTEVALTLHIAEGTEINATVYPVIVEGDEAGAYFAK